MMRKLLLLVLLLTGCERGAEPAPDELHTLVDSMLPALARLSSLEPRAEIQLDRRTSAQVLEYVTARLDEELPPATLQALHTTYTLLGVIPDTLDLRALLLQLYTEQIVGYYDPHEKTLYVVAGLAPSTVAPVLAHELVHALQDQYANLDSLISEDRGNDRQTAAHAALEGHATIVMFSYLAEQAAGEPIDPLELPNPADQLAAGATGDQFPIFRTAPAIIRETMLFPYVAGAGFMYRIWQQEPDSRPAPLGRWLPQSTEQVLAPREKFLGQPDDPTDLGLDSANPAGWRAVGTDNTLGMLETSIVLAHHLGESARAGADGWDGDRYRLLVNGAGQHLLVWYSVWDTETAAEAFRAAVSQMAGWNVARHDVDGMPGVRVVIASADFSFDTSALPQPRRDGSPDR